MALDRYEDLQLRYNSKVDTEYKPYLPVIGNVIPSKSLGKFDNLTEYTYSKSAGASGVDSGLNMRRAYRGASCRNIRIGVGINETGTITYTPSNALDIINLSDTIQNNFAEIKTTGKYLNGTSYKEMAHLVVNIGHFDGAGASGVTFGIKLYAASDYSKTATLKTANRKTLAPSASYKNNKYQFAVEEASFDLAGGFTEDDFEAITKIDFIFYLGGSACYIFLHEVLSALPAYEASHCEDSYYPEITEATSIYVSQLFGVETNSGETKALPVRTIEKALSLTTSTRINVVILDSATYKPVLLDYSDAGIRQTLADNVSIHADYLETPDISAKPGNMDEIRVGARTVYRNRFGDFNYGYTTIITVGASGADYTTIAAAYAAAADGNVIEVIDDGTYNEQIVKASGDSKTVFVQAAPGKKPVWTHTTATPYRSMIICQAGSSGKIYVSGFVLRGGSSTGTDYFFRIDEDVELEVIDCDITGCDNRFLDLTADFTNIKFINCLFIDNESLDEMISQASGISGTIEMINCVAYLNDGAQCIFTRSRKSNGTDALTYNYIGCIIKGTQKQTSSYIYETGDDSAANVGTVSNFYYNILGARLKTSGANNYRFTNRMRFNEVRDIESTGTDYKVFEYGANTVQFTNIIMKNNLFYNINASALGNLDLIWADTVFIGNWHITENVFSNIMNFSTKKARCILFGDFIVGTSIIRTKNVFYKCDVPFYYNETTGTVSATYCTFLATNYLAGAGTGGTVNIEACVVSGYGDVGSTGTIVLIANSWEEDPLFIDPAKNNFAYYPESRIEKQSALMSHIGDFVYPSGAYSLSFNFINFQGTYISCALSSAESTVTAQYCRGSGFGFFANAKLSELNILNTVAVDGGIFFRTNNAVKETVCEMKNCIVTDFGTGVLIKSGVDFENNTIAQCAYGVYELLEGYLSIVYYAQDYITIKDSIIFNNSVYDYVSKLPTNYCIIGTRYFDELDPADPDYAVTVGDNDINDNPLLDSDYFPALKCLGYLENSVAYGAASDGGNIGARDENHIKAVVSYDSYTVPSNSTVNGTLCGNPQDYSISIEPINLEESFDVSGNYTGLSDADITRYVFAWTEPGRKSKMMDTQKSVIELVYKTYWFTAFSIDGGDNWIYCKVNKSAPPTFAQVGFYYEQLPWSGAVEFIAIPDFNPTDYEVDTWA